MALYLIHNDMRYHIIARHEKTYRHTNLAMSPNFLKDPVHANLALIFALQQSRWDKTTSLAISGNLNWNNNPIMIIELHGFVQIVSSIQWPFHEPIDLVVPTTYNASVGPV